MLIAQLTEMYTLCFNIGKLKANACCPILKSYSNFAAVDVQSSLCFLSDNRYRSHQHSIVIHCAKCVSHTTCSFDIT